MSTPLPTRCLALLLALLGAVLNGCSSAAPQVSYYSLLDAHPAKPAAPSAPPLSISVGPVTVPDILNKSQIAIGGADGRYLVSDYHRWAGEVDRDFARALAEQLAGRLGTEQVWLYPGEQSLPPSHQVQLDILDMSGEPGGQARLVVRWSLIDPKTKTVKTTRRSTFSEPTAGPGYEGWVGSQRQFIARLAEEIAGAVRSMK